MRQHLSICVTHAMKKEKLHYVAASSIQDGESTRQTLDRILLELSVIFQPQWVLAPSHLICCGAQIILSHD